MLNTHRHCATRLFLAMVVLAAVSRIAPGPSLNAADVPTGSSSASVNPYAIAFRELAGMLRGSESRYTPPLGGFWRRSSTVDDGDSNAISKIQQNTQRRRDYRCGYEDGWNAALGRVYAYVRVDGNSIRTEVTETIVHDSGPVIPLSDEYLQGLKAGELRAERFVKTVEEELNAKESEILDSIRKGSDYREQVPRYRALLILQSLDPEEQNAPSTNGAAAGTDQQTSPHAVGRARGTGQQK